MNRPTRVLLLAALAGAACAQAPQSSPETRPPGPPRVQPAVVARHARQFDEELARRPAGSQQEEAAAAYILGHLQRAGYLVRLVGVPVANTVNSIDVLALPPGGEDPTAVVAVAYDSPPGSLERDGGSIGLFLEVGRALNVVDPDHEVEFAALGAEHARVGGGHLGSRRLARLLVDSAQQPLVLTIHDVDGRSQLEAFGAASERFAEAARDLGIPVTRLEPPEPEDGGPVAERHRIFTEAGLPHIAVSGDREALGRVLIRFLR